MFALIYSVDKILTAFMWFLATDAFFIRPT